MSTTRGYRIKPARTYSMPGVNDERGALVAEIGRYYARYFNRAVRPALVAAWLEMPVPQLQHMRGKWAELFANVNPDRR